MPFKFFVFWRQKLSYSLPPPLFLSVVVRLLFDVIWKWPLNIYFFLNYTLKYFSFFKKIKVKWILAQITLLLVSKDKKVEISRQYISKYIFHRNNYFLSISKFYYPYMFLCWNTLNYLDPIFVKILSIILYYYLLLPNNFYEGFYFFRINKSEPN